jgi:hypothetical protein
VQASEDKADDMSRHDTWLRTRNGEMVAGPLSLWRVAGLRQRTKLRKLEHASSSLLHGRSLGNGLHKMYCKGGS